MRTTPREVSKEDIGWIAGIIDGEASIYVKERDRYPYLQYSFQLINTNMEMLEKFQRIVQTLCKHNSEFTICKKKYSTGIVGRKQCYALFVRKIEDLKIMLTAILPHLTEKKDKAKYLLDILNNHKKYQWYKIERKANARRD